MLISQVWGIEDELEIKICPVMIMLDLKSILEKGYKAARAALLNVLEPETVIFKPSVQLRIGIGKHRAQK